MVFSSSHHTTGVFCLQWPPDTSSYEHKDFTNADASRGQTLIHARFNLFHHVTSSSGGELHQ